MDESPVGLRIDIVSDAICPWCYIGKRQLERALTTLAQEGLHFSVHWNPFQLNPDMPKEGRDRAAYRTMKFGSAEKSRELDERVAGAAANVGLDFRLDLMLRTPNTLDAHRLIWLAGREGVQDAVMEAVFVAYFTQGRDIGDRDVLADCAARRRHGPRDGRRFPGRRCGGKGNARRRPRRTRGRGERRAVVLPRRLWPLFRRHAGRHDGRGAAQGTPNPSPARGLARFLSQRGQELTHCRNEALRVLPVHVVAAVRHRHQRSVRQARRGTAPPRPPSGCASSRPAPAAPAGRTRARPPA